jgi:hypothetical protein
MRITQLIALELGAVYMYDTWERINLRADKLKIGDVLVGELLPTGGMIDTSFAPVVREQRNTSIVFMTHCDLDFEGASVGLIIDDMLALAKRYLVRLDASLVFEPVGTDVEWQVLIDRLDANMAGVALSLTLKENQGECVNG